MLISQSLVIGSKYKIMPELSQLAQAGIAGVSIALILLIAFILKLVFGLIGNHFKHNTKILQKVADKLDEDMTAQKESIRMIRELKEWLLMRNGRK